MNILVTGGAGFIGSSLCQFLKSPTNHITIIDNFDDFYDPKIKEANIKELLQDGCVLHRLDVKQINQIGKKNFDIIVHLAGKGGVRPSIKNPQSYIDANIVGTQSVLDFAKDNGIKKLIFASSSSVYGNNKKQPFSENDVVNHPISPYAFTKRACESLNHTYHHLYGLDIINLRFFTVYGPKQRPDLAIYKFTRLIKEGKEISQYGDGSNARDFTYIDDILQGINGAINYLINNKNIFEIVNLGNNHPIKLNHLINTIKNNLSEEIKIKYLPMQPGDVDITYADISKAKRLFNYNPKTSFEEGIQKFINWYESEVV